MLKVINRPHQTTLGPLGNGGCVSCIQGKKMVLFVTGMCHYQCEYCPIAESRRQKDVIYANEWLVEKDEDIIEEAKLTNAVGAGITGGDPFIKAERTVNYIKMLKKEFGKSFHIHLYAPLEQVTKEKMKLLYDAGLDEIRLHPTNLKKEELWHKIAWMKEFKWRYGLEIPCIPGEEEQTYKLIEYAKDMIQFINLNELEMSEDNSDALRKKGHKPKTELEFGIKGSDELARQIIKYSQEKKYPFTVHYCTAKFKDKIQMGLRLKRRASNVARPFDIISEDGMLNRGAIFLNELKPGFGYHNKIKQVQNKDALIQELAKARRILIASLQIPQDLIEVDEEKLRLLTSMEIAEHFKKKIKAHGYVPALIEEYPTKDAMELEVEFI